MKYRFKFSIRIFLRVNILKYIFEYLDYIFRIKIYNGNCIFIRTNNFVIEIESRDSLSGLMTTKAKFWVLYDDKVFYVIKPSEIIKCIFFNKLTYSEFFCSGDNFKKKAFLIKKDMLFKYASKII